MYFTSSPWSSPASSIYSTYAVPSSSATGGSSGSGPSCAYPSWPRRASLNDALQAEPTSYISDNDLFPDVFDDNDSDCTPIASPCRSPPRGDRREMETISFTAVRNMLALHKELQPEQKKNKRKRRSSSSSSRKSRSGPARQMSPILEAGE